MGESYYDVLDVDADATEDEIRRAYRDHALETHPDHNESPDATAEFERLSRAKSVLLDDFERARYDRLGHAEYVRLEFGDRPSAEPSDSDTGTEAPGDDPDPEPTKSDGESPTGRETDDTSTNASEGTEPTGSGGDRDPSRSAGSRADASGRDDPPGGRPGTGERSRTSGAASAARRAASSAADWNSGDNETSANGRSSGRRGPAPGSVSTDSSAGVGYAVHDWEGEADLEWSGQPFDASTGTGVAIGTFWLLYPVFVAGSLTGIFPLPINAIVATCTLVLIGYVVLNPRLGTAVFGFWSLLFPVGIYTTDLPASLAVDGQLALAFAWLPFAYAVLLQWAIGP